MYIYKINNNVIVQVRQEANDYVLQENEFGFTLPIIQYEIVDNVLTDLTTQADRDAQANLQLEQQVQQDLEKEIRDGVRAANQLKVYLKNNLNESQYKTARNMLLPVWTALRSGDWDIALDEMNAITVNNEPYISMKSTIVAKLEQYLGI